MSKRKESAVSEIANAIVDLVEWTGGPVTLARIEREIAGFKADDDVKRSWEWVIGEDQDENLIWDGMSDEGCSALRKILLGAKLQCSRPQNWFISWKAGAQSIKTGSRSRWSQPEWRSWIRAGCLFAARKTFWTSRRLVRGMKD